MKRSASAVWKGGLKDGTVTVSTETGVLSNVPYNFRMRFENERGTNPEELIAAAHAACYSMALSMILGDAGMKAEEMRLLGAIQADPALISISTIVILAEGCLGPPTKPADAVGLIAGRIALTSEELDDLTRRGEIACGTTLAALCLYRAQQRS